MMIHCLSSLWLLLIPKLTSKTYSRTHSLLWVCTLRRDKTTTLKVIKPWPRRNKTSINESTRSIVFWTIQLITERPLVCPTLERSPQFSRIINNSKPLIILILVTWIRSCLLVWQLSLPLSRNQRCSPLDWSAGAIRLKWIWTKFRKKSQHPHLRQIAISLLGVRAQSTSPKGVCPRLRRYPSFRRSKLPWLWERSSQSLKSNKRLIRLDSSGDSDPMHCFLA